MIQLRLLLITRVIHNKRAEEVRILTVLKNSTERLAYIWR